MQKTKVDDAVVECKRFLEAVKKLEWKKFDVTNKGGVYYLNTNKYSGALRRASMDLTRALAEMRKY